MFDARHMLCTHETEAFSTPECDSGVVAGLCGELMHNFLDDLQLAEPLEPADARGGRIALAVLRRSVDCYTRLLLGAPAKYDQPLWVYHALVVQDIGEFDDMADSLECSAASAARGSSADVESEPGPLLAIVARLRHTVATLRLVARMLEPSNESDDDALLRAFGALRERDAVLAVRLARAARPVERHPRWWARQVCDFAQGTM